MKHTERDPFPALESEIQPAPEGEKPAVAVKRDRKEWSFRLLDGNVAKKVRVDTTRTDGSTLKTIWWESVKGEALRPANHLIPLYLADDLAKSREAPFVVVCEGEKAADALRDAGIPVVGTAGALYTPSREALSVLRGHVVILWADNDHVGRRHMGRIASRLAAMGFKDIRVVRWKDAPPRGDAADVRDRELLAELLKTAIPWRPYTTPSVQALSLHMRDIPDSPMVLRPQVQLQSIAAQRAGEVLAVAKDVFEAVEALRSEPANLQHAIKLKHATARLERLKEEKAKADRANEEKAKEKKGQADTAREENAKEGNTKEETAKEKTAGKTEEADETKKERRGSGEGGNDG